MRHPAVGWSAAACWLTSVAAGLAANRSSALVWLVPIAVVATVALAFGVSRTLTWALPVAALAGLDPSAGWWRAGLALLAVVAAMAAVGILDTWSDAGPDRAEAAVLSGDDRMAWRAARRPALVRLAVGALVVACGWAASTSVSWSPPGWLVAGVPVVAVGAIAAALWPYWRPVTTTNPLR